MADRCAISRWAIALGACVAAFTFGCATRPPATSPQPASDAGQRNARPWLPLEPSSPFILTGTSAAVLLQGPALVSRESLVEFSPDGTVFATLDRGIVQIRDAKSGHLRAEARGPALGFVWSESGRQLVITAQNGLFVWDMTTGEGSYIVQPKGTSVQHESCRVGRSCALFSPNGEQLLVPGMTHLGLWDLKHRSLQSQIPIRVAIRDLAWSPSGSQFTVLRREEGDVQIYDSATAKPERNLAAPTELGRITAAVFAPKGNQMAVGGKFGRVAIVDTTNARTLLVSPELRGQISALAWHPNSSLLAIGLSTGDNASTYLWSMGSNPPQPVSGIERLAGSPVSWDVTALTWNPSGTALGVFDVFPLVDESFKAAVVDAITRKVLRITDGTFQLGALNPSLTHALRIKGRDDTLALIDLASKAVVFSLPLRPRLTGGWAFESGIPRLLLDDVRFDFRQGTAQRSPGEAVAHDFPRISDQERNRFDGFVVHSALSPDGTRVVASEDSMESVHCYFDVAKTACVAPLASAMGRGTQWVFSPSGKWLGARTVSSISEDSYVGIYDAKTAKAVAKLSSGNYSGFHWLSDEVVLETHDDTPSFRLIRWKDGRTLDGYLFDETPSKTMPHDMSTLLVRDDGVFDGSASAFKSADFRNGPNVKSAPLVPLKTASHPYHEGLLKEFLSGK
jgi:WD40 repeat protein